MRILPVITAVALAATLSACTTNGTPTDPASTAASTSSSSSTASAQGGPVDPERHEVKKGPGYELIVPSAWTEAVLSSSKLTTKPVRWMQDGTDASPIFVGVTIDDEKKNDAEHQSLFMEKTADVTGKKNLKRTKVDWDGAKDAYLIEWDEELGGTSHVMQLMAQLDSGDIVNVVGRAPADQFEKANIKGIVDSLKLKG